MNLETIVLMVVPVVFAITLHEAAHGYVARMFGDRTAEMLGRITLNPIKHIDPVGTLAVPAILLLFGSPFLFGWAKPVPVNFGNLRNPKRDMLWVAIAGPGANLVMAVLWALVYKFSAPSGGADSTAFATMAQIGISVNLVLMALNLLPIPPLDGGRVAVSLLPNRAAYAWSRLEPYGLFIIIGLLIMNQYTGIFNALLSPLVDAGQAIVSVLTGVELPNP
jgi:Zn-dependent protease